jgi:hypothetical protein
VTLRRAAALSGGVIALAVWLALAGCGAAGDDGARGTARLWVTKERGTVLLVDTVVPAGQTLLRALRSQADVETRYGGRFVQAIEGMEGSLGRQQDWFWFVNGLAGDRSAAEYRLRPGDIAWWDFRSWRDDAALEVVAGAFPEPLVHGYDGKTRPAAIRYGPGVSRPRVRALARRLGTGDVEPLGRPVADGAHLLEIVAGMPALSATLREPGSGASGAVRFLQRGWPAPSLYRHRFSTP